jgi:hypothetical protein
VVNTLFALFKGRTKYHTFLAFRQESLSGMMRVFIPLGDTLNISNNHVEMEEAGTREGRQ